MAQNTSTTKDFDAIVIGAGFAGMYQLVRLRQLGMRVRVLERGPEVGGTWYWNRYPGARCDVPSLDYSYSFDEGLQQQWTWSEKFATQPEILSYAKHVADRFDLRRDIDFETFVTGAEWNEKELVWKIAAESTKTGTQSVYSARYLILAVGNLSSSNVPALPGLESFEGRMFHTSEWPHEPVDFTGRRVGIIGTGSSGIQVIPLVAKEAEHLHVFQRTANYSLPAGNRPLSEEELTERKGEYAEYREIAKRSATGMPVPVGTKSVFEVSDEEREQAFEEAWYSGRYGALLAAYTDLAVDVEANALAAEFIRDKVRSIVKDQEVAEMLAPRDVHFGTKRTCLDSNYYETFNRDNVTLVSLHKEIIEQVEPQGLRTTADKYEFDDLILATGFDAMTGSFLAVNPIGEGGLSLQEAWNAGPYTYLGVASHGFPNMFMITGPGSPSVLSNMFVSIEQHVDWITELIEKLEASEHRTVQPTAQSQIDWMQTVHDEAAATLYLTASSWYLGANIPGKPRVFMPYVAGVGAYREIAEQVAADGYQGFEFDRAGEAASLNTPQTKGSGTA